MNSTKKKPITIKELASMLGLAHSTVSRALNNNPTISQQTRKLIQEKANQLGYIPNNAARILKNEPSHIIGLVIPDIKNDFYTTVAKTITDASSEHSLQLILATTDDIPEREYFAILNLLKVRAEGVIITLCQKPLPETLELLKKLKYIQLIRSFPNMQAPSVTVNDQAGIYRATKHLLDLGHSKIAYIGTPVTSSTGNNRLIGFKKALNDFNIDISDQLIKLGPPRSHFGEQALESLFSNSFIHPTAIVIGSSRTAIGVIKQSEKMKIKIPKQLSLVGYGDSEWYSVWSKGLTTLSLPEQTIADCCVNLLLDSINNKLDLNPNSSIRNYNFESSLIIRGSTQKLER